VPDLNFQVEKAEPAPFAVAPLLTFKLRVSQRAAGAAPIHAVVLQCQVRIEPTKRRYETSEGARLLDLFDRPGRWGRTMRPMLWTHASVVVPSFTDGVLVDLPVPCTFDFTVAATKYFYALEGGEAPLSLLFSGTVFHEVEGAGLQASPIPREKEASFRLPASVWREMMEHYYPNTAWLCLRRDVFDRLYLYKSRRGLPTWEQALEAILPPADERGSS
jgi:hypothetical protein